MLFSFEPYPFLHFTGITQMTRPDTTNTFKPLSQCECRELPLPAIMLRLSGEILHVNKAWEQLSGYTLKTVQGHNVLEFMAEGQESGLETFIHQIKEGKPCQTVVEGMHAGGTRIMIELDSRMLMFTNDLAGERGLHLFITDVTEREYARMKLHQENLLNKSLLNISEMMLTPGLTLEQIASRTLELCCSITQSRVGAIGILDFHTRRYRTLAIRGEGIEYMEDQEIRRIDQIMQDEAQAYPNLMARTLKSGEEFYHNHTELVLSEKNAPGHYFELKNILGMPIRHNEQIRGQIILANAEKGFHQTERDSIRRIARIYTLSLLKQHIELEAMKARRLAEESNRLKSEFLANISHEIRTPMNAIIGFSDLIINDDYEPEELKSFLKIISSSSQRLIGVITNIMDASKLAVGSFLPNPVVTDLERFMKEIQEELDYKLSRASKGVISIRILKGFNETHIYKIEPVLLKRVFELLADNSVKYTDTGSIEVGCQLRKCNRLLFWVEDTGCGIKEKHHKDLFKKFMTIPHDRPEHGTGLGLGLNIAKGIVHLLGGRMGIRSVPAGGTRIWFSIQA